MSHGPCGPPGESGLDTVQISTLEVGKSWEKHPTYNCYVVYIFILINTHNKTLTGIKIACM